MVREFEEPIRLWIEGRPQSFRKNKASTSRYLERIKNAASALIPAPTESTRLDVEIFFETERSLRADVDNVIKPILDALQGIAYLDDRQVRSVKVTALPSGEPYRLSGWMDSEILYRLKKEPPEFLINIYDRFSTPCP